jgi:hypothetical protein
LIHLAQLPAIQVPALGYSFTAEPAAYSTTNPTIKHLISVRLRPIARILLACAIRPPDQQPDHLAAAGALFMLHERVQHL